MTPKKTRADDPTPEKMRECLKEGYCWWCNTGGWTMLAGHTSRIHGISAEDMRELALVSKNYPTCTPSYSYILSLRPQNIPNLLKAQAAPRAKHHTYGTAGLISAREKIAKISGPEQRSRAGLKAAEKTRKPHPCPACGKILPTSTPKTCSPECRKVIRQRTALITKETKDRLRKEKGGVKDVSRGNQRGR